MKKIAILGGGTSMSYLLKGLKLFPVDLTAIITVSDNGRSTGILREEFNMPAIGDIRQAMVALSTIDDDIKELLQYRFHTTSDLNGHSIGNLLLTGMFNISGNLTNTIKHLSKFLNVKGTILPLSEDRLTLLGKTATGSIIEGEENITKCNDKIIDVFYKEKPHVLKEVITALKEADLIILSAGSMFTSILPHLACEDVLTAIKKSNAKKMYVCNLMTQPGETDGFCVSDHLKVYERYLGKNVLDVVLANNQKIEKNLAKKYETLEQKDPVFLDREEVEKMNIEIIEDHLVTIADGTIRHDGIKAGSLIFSYLMR